MSSSGPVSVLAFWSRQPSLSQEQFYEEWEKHSSLEIPWLAKHGVIEYIQLRTPDEMRNTLEKALETLPHKPKMLPFDGCSVITCESVERLLGGFLDPYYAEVVATDETRFVDTAHSQLQLAGGVPPAGTMGKMSRWLVDGKPTIDVTEGERRMKEVADKHAAK